MPFEYSPCTLAEIETLQQEHVQTLTAPVDTYLDPFVFGSQFYTIHVEGALAGFFAIHQNTELTQFYLQKTYLPVARAIFQDIIRQNKVTTALVSTCDELLYDVALDEFAKIEKLGYYFQEGNKNPVVPDVETIGSFQQATAKDIPPIIAMSGTFFDELERRIEHQEIFVLYAKNELLGAGVIEKSRLQPGYVSVGMFVNPTHRCAGIGAAIIARLKRRCYNHGFIPIAGCAYENVGSKRTLEKAGLVSKTQLLKVQF